MRRQRRMHHSDNDYGSRITYSPLNGDGSGSLDSDVSLENVSTTNNKLTHRFENTIEAQVDEGDTLQALALRFHCTVADIKRLNKIDKDNEIHARKVVKIPVTVHSVLLGTLPAVHTSGNSSPKHAQNSLENEPDIMRNPLENAQTMLNEKLLVASVNASGGDVASSSSNNNVNKIIMNSKVTTGKSIYTDDDVSSIPPGNDRDSNDATSPLISDILIDDVRSSHLRQIPGPSALAIDWSGSDCDMSWVCLFVVILGLCVVIPLICVVYFTEHSHHHHQHLNSSLH